MDLLLYVPLCVSIFVKSQKGQEVHPSAQASIPHWLGLLVKKFFFAIYFERERERERESEQGRGRERGRENAKQASRCQHNVGLDLTDHEIVT